jgi:spore germination cell wall hydrolase CwlJ-like protein
VVNVLTRPDIITVAVSLPQRKGIVAMWDPIDNEVGLGDSPEWYTDYEANIHYDDSYLKSKFIFTNKRSYSAAEHVCLAKNIYFEARNESLKGQIAIALVTLNRLQEARWSEEVCGVVYDNKQFSWFSDGLSDRPRNYASYDSVALVASHMLDADMAMYDFTYGSTHYHANYVSPYWSDYMILKVKIDTHLFYFEPVVQTTASLL